MRTLEKIIVLLPVLFVCGHTLLGLTWLVEQVWLLWVVVALAAAHLTFEKYRWQMMPVYLVFVYLPVIVFQSQRNNVAAISHGEAALVLAGLFLAMSLLYLFPIPRWPTPTGSFAVGTTTLYLCDNSRFDPYAEVADQPRELMIQIWYPVRPDAAAEPACMHPHFGEQTQIATHAFAKLIQHHLKVPFVPSFLFSHLRLLRTTAVAEAPIIPGQHPVLFFVHGAVGVRGQNLSLMEELASHGYIMVSADHTYGSLYVEFPDDRVVYFSDDAFPTDVPLAESGKKLVQVWADDVSFVLDELLRYNQMAEWPLANHLNLQQVGVLGHSTGGATAVTCCQQDARFRLGVGLDAWLEALPSQQAAPAQPMLLTQSVRWLGPKNSVLGWQLYQRLAQGYALTFDQTAHQSFSDVPLFFAEPLARVAGLIGQLNIYTSLSTLHCCLLGYLSVYLPSQTNTQSGRVFVDVAVAFQTTLANAPFIVQQTSQITGVPIYENA